MAIPVIDTTTSVLAYNQWQLWAYQPAATNNPTSWTALGVPAGMVFGSQRTVADGATATSTALTSATAGFTAADVGAGVSGAGIPFGTTIASVTNATTVVLSAATTANASGVSVTITRTDGLLNGAASVPGVYLVTITATNGTGPSVPVVLTIGIAPASAAADTLTELVIDAETGVVTLGVQGSANSGTAAAATTNKPTPLLMVKENDDLLLRIFLTKGGNIVDANLTGLNLAIKEFEPDNVLNLSDGWGKVSSGADPNFLLHIAFTGTLLASEMSNYQADTGTYFYALAEIERVEVNPLTVGPPSLRRTSQTFWIRIERNINP